MVVPIREKMWRITFKFAKPREVPPGWDVTYIRAPTAMKAKEIAQHNHRSDFGGIKDIIVNIMKEPQQHDNG